MIRNTQSRRERRIRLGLVLALATIGIECTPLDVDRDGNAVDEADDHDTLAGTFVDPGPFMAPPSVVFDGPERVCPDLTQFPRTVVEIREADPEVDFAHHQEMLARLVAAVQRPNTTILLGPDVVLDFTHATAEQIPLEFKACVTLMSVDRFPPDTASPEEIAVALAAPSGASALGPDAVLTSPFTPRSARRSNSLGPVIKFGPSRGDDEKVLFSIRSIAGGLANDNVRISGFRLFGPSFGQQETAEIGIQIDRSIDVEISNMEIAGWAQAGIKIIDDVFPTDSGSGQNQPDNLPGERIGRYDQIRIFHNYIHHNQKPSTAGSANGYGVAVNQGAWAQVYENLFDFNRHAIEADGEAGGYDARRNLVLKGGGVHREGLFGTHTHQFDIHGKGPNGFGEQASVKTLYSHNSFQYSIDNAIKVRGRPKIQVHIHDNIFPHDNLEGRFSGSAIRVHDREDLDDVIDIGPGNTLDFDSYGNYEIGDFDADGMDDVFLATGRTWWFSSGGEFPWTYLSAHAERIDQLSLVYFDADLVCDVLVERDGEWFVSRGGVGPLESLGAFGTPLADVGFGRFDPAVIDTRPEATRQTTHAFRSRLDGTWEISLLVAPDWRPIGSSSFKMSKFRFGDFTGDGVTDVLAVERGRWAISKSARELWAPLNPDIDEPVKNLLFADLDHNNIDDIIKVETVTTTFGSGPAETVKETLTFYVSDDGRGPWRELRSYSSSYPRTFSSLMVPLRAFAGRFGVVPGGATLLIDHERIGRFFSPAEAESGRLPDWDSSFSY